MLGTFEVFHRLTANLSGPERLALFGKLAPNAQESAWRALAAGLEEARK